jgi:hypothetical protein
MGPEGLFGGCEGLPQALRAGQGVLVGESHARIVAEAISPRLPLLAEMIAFPAGWPSFDPLSGPGPLLPASPPLPDGRRGRNTKQPEEFAFY